MKLIDPKVRLMCYTCNIEVRARKSKITRAMMDHIFTPDHQMQFEMQGKSSLERNEDDE